MNEPRGVQLRSTAYHEAGHAVVGRMLGLRCGRIELFRRGDVMGQAFIEDPLRRWERGDGPRRKLAEAFCVTLYAGAEAEGVFAPIEYAGDAQDRERATETLKLVGVRGAQWVGDGAWERREELLRRKANMLVGQYFYEIQRVAGAVLEAGCLEGGEVDAIIRSEPGRPLLPMLDARSLVT